MSKRAYLAIAYVIVLHLLFAALVVKSQTVPRLMNKLEMTGVVHEARAALANRPGLVLLGDSHTEHLGDIPGALNLGVSGEVTAGLLHRLPIYPLDGARAISLMIGTNDVWHGKLAGLPARLRAIEQEMPAGVPIVWSAIPPADDVRIDLHHVRDANQVIRTLCAAHPRCTYVDTWALLADASGHLILRYFGEDHVHLNAEGYHRWLAAIVAALDNANLESDP